MRSRGRFGFPDLPCKLRLPAHRRNLGPWLFADHRLAGLEAVWLAPVRQAWSGLPREGSRHPHAQGAAAQRVCYGAEDQRHVPGAHAVRGQSRLLLGAALRNVPTAYQALVDSLSLECCAGVAERQLCCVQQECDFLLHWVPLCAAPLQQMMAALLLQPRAAHIQRTVLLPCSAFCRRLEWTSPWRSVTLLR